MQKKRRGGATKIPVTLAALGAIGIILGKFLAFNVTEFMRFSLENTTIIFAGIVFGPILGAAVGAVQDLVGCIAVGYAINPIITLGCAVVGLISGAAFKLFRKIPLTVRVALCMKPVLSFLALRSSPSVRVVSTSRTPTVALRTANCSRLVFTSAPTSTVIFSTVSPCAIASCSCISGRS